MLNEYMSRCGLKACVVSLSGGVDSACTLALLKHAQRTEGSPIERVVAIAQPIKSTEHIWRRALRVGAALSAEVITVDQSELHTRLQGLCDSALLLGARGGGGSGGSGNGNSEADNNNKQQQQPEKSSSFVDGLQFASGQLKSYMRTPVSFYVSQVLTHVAGLPCVVVGTGNYDEDGYLLYFCKAGDGVCDLQIIADLHKSEVFTVARLLGVPEEVLQAPPSADLWEGQTDEQELGVSYDFVELLTEWLRYSPQDQRELLQGLSEPAVRQWDTLKHRAEQVHRRNMHKQNYPLNLNVLQ